VGTEQSETAVVEERRTLRARVYLTVATLGFSTAISVITTYLPLLLRRYTSSAALVGLAIGGEGVFALAIPLVAGILSDRIWTRWGKRRPFMIASAPFMAAALIVAPFQPSYLGMALATFVFFAAYHFYVSPYQSLVSDASPVEAQGRVQGLQTFMRGCGMFLGMVVAGVLFGRWYPLPFVAAALIIMVTTYLTVANVQEREPSHRVSSAHMGLARELRSTWRVMRKERQVRLLLVANYLWEFTISGFRPFAMLYFLAVLGASTEQGALVLGILGGTYVVAGLASGWLADRWGRKQVMWFGLWIYMVGCLAGFFVRELGLAMILLVLFGLGGSTVLTLPYAILMRIMPKERVGQFTGLFTMTRGLAALTGPIIMGLAIDAAAPFIPDTGGYVIMWPLSGVALGISMLVFRRIKVE
jgi:MFS family permease